MNDMDPTIGERASPSAQLTSRTGMVRPALAVEIDHEYVEHRPGYVSIPYCFDDAFARPFMHELLHFWQTLSPGFIANLAVAEWRATKDFQASGRLSSDVDLALRFTATPTGAPFSPWQLSESLCRFWDVHIYGPMRLVNEQRGHEVSVDPDSEVKPYSSSEFDAAITADDTYADPGLRAASWHGIDRMRPASDLTPSRVSARVSARRLRLRWWRALGSKAFRSRRDFLGPDWARPEAELERGRSATSANKAIAIYATYSPPVRSP